MKIECTQLEKEMILSTIIGDNKHDGVCFFEAKDCCGYCKMCVNNNIEFTIKDKITYEYAVEVFTKDSWNFLRQIDVTYDKSEAIEIGKTLKVADDEEVHITTIERELLNNGDYADCDNYHSEKLEDLM